MSAKIWDQVWFPKDAVNAVNTLSQEKNKFLAFIKEISELKADNEKMKIRKTELEEENKILNSNLKSSKIKIESVLNRTVDLEFALAESFQKLNESLEEINLLQENLLLMESNLTHVLEENSDFLDRISLLESNLTQIMLEANCSDLNLEDDGSVDRLISINICKARKSSTLCRHHKNIILSVLLIVIFVVSSFSIIITVVVNARKGASYKPFEMEFIFNKDTDLLINKKLLCNQKCNH